ncbi:MAG: HIT family protein [Desulfovibrio sp.]|jgi:histidine triad (HIT) family protein|nr:HIT family protein [Desulfovibrio sp.]
MPYANRPVDKDCVFCRIVAGAIPCARVYEDENILAFLDIQPIAPGHTLAILKGHYPTLLEVPPREAEGLFIALKKVAAAQLKVLGAGGFHCLQNNFPLAGQTVFHAHWHLIPRAAGDGLALWPGQAYESDKRMREVAEALHSHITAGRCGGQDE